MQARLEADLGKLWSLHELEKTGGEPDVLGHDKKTGEYLFFDRSPESPKGRGAVCCDRAALDSRKEFKPKTSAIDMATAMGVDLLTEEKYHQLQKLGEFDLKTTTWVKPRRRFASSAAASSAIAVTAGSSSATTANNPTTAPAASAPHSRSRPEIGIPLEQLDQRIKDRRV